MSPSLRVFLIRSAIGHLVFFSLFIFVVPCVPAKPKPALNFLGAVLSRHELDPKHLAAQSYAHPGKTTFNYEPAVFSEKWQANRGVGKPKFRAAESDAAKPNFKEIQKINRPSPAPKRHATLEEIGVYLEAPPKIQLDIKP